MTRALNMYEHDPRFASILFDDVDERIPQRNEQNLVDTALRRLPLLVTKDPSLAYQAIPFMRNLDDVRRLLEAYRADNSPHPESLPASLNLGVIDEETMMQDFFSYTTSQYSATNQLEHVLYLHLIRELWNLLRNDASRDAFVRNLSAFSGVIVEDADDDSYPESFARYDGGKVQNFDYDADQDGIAELSLRFFADDELPQKAEVSTMDDASESSGFFAYLMNVNDSNKIYLDYYDYPSVKSARLGFTDYFPVYREFHFAPVDFVPITGGGEMRSDMPLYPELVSSLSRLTKRSLISFANIIKRPSREFPEAVEEIHLTNSVVNSAREVLSDGSIVSEMFFEMGEPYLQYVDLDTDGRRETRRLFVREHERDVPREDPTDYEPVLEQLESDFDGDDSYEYGEIYLNGKVMQRSWDYDGDGIRETRK
jgi:hypothetical protein